MRRLTEGLVIMADPDFHAKWLQAEKRKCFWHNKRQIELMRNYDYTPMVSDREIAREAELDDIVELMDGYAV